MNQECSIVRDLLPLYAERLTSPETAAFVEKHLRTCADCRAAPVSYTHLRAHETL